MIIGYLFLILLSGIISVDRNNALNLMLSRPIVISLIFYLFFEPNNVILLIGILYEIYGVIDIPVGTHIPRDDSFATYSSSLTIIFGSINNSLDFLLLFLLGLVLMHFATLIDGYTRKINRILYNKIEKCKTFKPNYLISTGIALTFLKGIIVYNLGAILLIKLLKFVPLETDQNIGLYGCLLVTVVAAYFIEYFEIFGNKKYIFVISGFILGWILV